MSTDKTLATFKVDKNHWLDFQSLATASDTNATQVLRIFIVACLEGRIDIKAIQPVEQPTFNLDERIDSAMLPLIEKLSSLERLVGELARVNLRIEAIELNQAEMEALKFNLANQPKSPSQNDLQQTLDHNPVRSYLPKKASNMPLEASGVKPLSSMSRGVCSHCGSSELVKKGKSESVDRGGLTGRRVKCKACGKGSTFWEAVD